MLRLAKPEPHAQACGPVVGGGGGEGDPKGTQDHTWQAETRGTPTLPCVPLEGHKQHPRFFTPKKNSGPFGGNMTPTGNAWVK